MLSYAGNCLRSHVTFTLPSLFFSHSTFFASITRLTYQNFLLYKTLVINIGGTTVLHLCFTGTLALKLLVRVCTKTHKFYILLPSDPPRFGLIIQAWVDFNSSSSSSSPITTAFFPPKKTVHWSVLTSSLSSERLSRICFLHPMALERSLLNWSLTWRAWIQRKRVFFLLTLHS